MKSITNSPSLQHQDSSGECGIEPALGGISTNAQTSQSCCRNANPYRGCDHPAPTMKSITNSPSLQHQDSSGECGIEPALGGISTNAQTSQSCCRNANPYRGCDHPAPTMKSMTNSPSLQHQDSSGECGIEPALGGISTNAQTSQSCCRNANPYRGCDHPAPTMKSITNSPSLQHQDSSGECGIEPALGRISTNAQTSQSCCRNANPYRGCDHPAPTMKSITNSPSLQHQVNSGECGIEPALGGTGANAQTSQSCCRSANPYRDCDHPAPTMVTTTIPQILQYRDTNRGGGIGPFSRESDTNAQTLQSCCRNVCPCLDCAHLASSVKSTSYNNYNRIYQQPIIARKAIMADNGDKVDQLINSGVTPMSAYRKVSDLRFTFDKIVLQAPISAILRGNAHNNHFNSTTNITHENLQSGLWGPCSGKMRWRLLIWKGPCEPSGNVSRCCPTLPNPRAPQLQ